MKRVALWGCNITIQSLVILLGFLLKIIIKIKHTYNLNDNLIFVASNLISAQCEGYFNEFLFIYEEYIEPSEQQSREDFYEYFKKDTHLFTCIIQNGKVISGTIIAYSHSLNMALLAYTWLLMLVCALRA